MNDTTTPTTRREAEIECAHAADAVHAGPRANEPCDLAVKPDDGRGAWTAVCTTHDFFRSLRRDDDPVLCDHGRRWTFLVHLGFNDEEPPELMDLTGLYREVRGVAQNVAAHNVDSIEPSVIHRYLLDGTCQRDLTFNVRRVGDNQMECYVGAAPEADYLDLLNWPEPKTYAEDGTTYLRFVMDIA